MSGVDAPLLSSCQVTSAPPAPSLARAGRDWVLGSAHTENGIPIVPALVTRTALMSASPEPQKIIPPAPSSPTAGGSDTTSPGHDNSGTVQVTLPPALTCAPK